jgi:hypothetical protein
VSAKVQDEVERRGGESLAEPSLMLETKKINKCFYKIYLCYARMKFVFYI